MSVSCDELDPSWTNIMTTTQFPVATGATLILSCVLGYQNEGSDKVTCDSGTSYSFETEPSCLGKLKAKQHILLIFFICLSTQRNIKSYS